MNKVEDVDLRMAKKTTQAKDEAPRRPVALGFYTYPQLTSIVPGLLSRNLSKKP
jgi:hypothetical protein